MTDIEKGTPSNPDKTGKTDGLLVDDIAGDVLTPAADLTPAYALEAAERLDGEGEIIGDPILLKDGREVTVRKGPSQIRIYVDGLCKSIGDIPYYEGLGDGDLGKGIEAGVKDFCDVYNNPPRSNHDDDPDHLVQ